MTDGGIDSSRQKNTVALYYHLLSIDAGASGIGVTIPSSAVSQVTGYQIAATLTWVSTATGSVICLPETSAPMSLSGVQVVVANTTATALTAYPNIGDLSATINGSSTFTVAGNSVTIFHCVSPGVWFATSVMTTGIQTLVQALQVVASTSVQSPLISGGSASNSTLSLESSSAGGSGDFIRFLTGATPTEAARVSSSGGVSIGVTTDAGANNLLVKGSVLTEGGGVGYLTGVGAGGTISQSSSKSTTVVLNTITGQITMNAAALGASTTVSFTLTNSTIAATDLLVLNHVSAGTAGSYTLNAQAGTGSATINVRNVSLGSLSEAIVIGFVVIKGATT